MESKMYRTGIIGMGGMGKAHFKTLRTMENVNLVAIASVSVDNAISYVNQQGLSCRVYEDSFEMIEKEMLDILYVCLPPYAHSGQIEAAAAKGVHIFNEKPIALTIERAKSINKAVNDAGVYSQVGYQMRFGGAVQKLKELIENGTAGTPTLFTARYECNSLHSPWWCDKSKSGGQVFEQVIHLYDLAMHFMGLPKIVCGFIANLQHNNIPGYTVEDTSVASICFENGSLANISGSNCSVPGQWRGMFRVICKNLVADFDDCNNATITYTNEKEIRTEILSYNYDLRLLENEYFIDVVRGNKPPFATMNEGLYGLLMVDSVIKSSSKFGAPINVEY